ncbi:hypothetical protein Vadar_017993 [Vaccinium darrowii]|uniref:Uncharacterized protein n=1 Tax=Vaccinium darrowii TaxID=229202 RepID=A0ACB7ZDH0_9ERIC|nr:hypothetical protein Vadar_017993 [Vaccinium darrowii]
MKKKLNFSLQALKSCMLLTEFSLPSQGPKEACFCSFVGHPKKVAIEATLKKTRGRTREEEGRLCKKNAEQGCFSSHRSRRKESNG